MTRQKYEDRSNVELQNSIAVNQQMAWFALENGEYPGYKTSTKQKYEELKQSGMKEYSLVPVGQMGTGLVAEGSREWQALALHGNRYFIYELPQ